MCSSPVTVTYMEEVYADVVKLRTLTWESILNYPSVLEGPYKGEAEGDFRQKRRRPMRETESRERMLCHWLWKWRKSYEPRKVALPTGKSKGTDSPLELLEGTRPC